VVLIQAFSRTVRFFFFFLFFFASSASSNWRGEGEKASLPSSYAYNQNAPKKDSTIFFFSFFAFVAFPLDCPSLPCHPYIVLYTFATTAQTSLPSGGESLGINFNAFQQASPE
jgi:hypothetical protein